VHTHIDSPSSPTVDFSAAFISPPTTTSNNELVVPWLVLLHLERNRSFPHERPSTPVDDEDIGTVLAVVCCDGQDRESNYVLFSPICT
jgi:hypothetical protein